MNSDIVDAYSGSGSLPEVEIFDDPNMTNEEKKDALGSLMEPFRPRMYWEDEKPSPLMETSVNILALILYWADSDFPIPENHGGSQYNFWCSVIKHNCRSVDNGSDFVDDFIVDGWKMPENMMTVRDRDIDLANTIIDYYKIKLSHRTLMNDGQSFSEYETKLASFINSKPNEFKHDELGVIVRLPETYNVDLIFDKFIQDYDSLPPYEPQWTSLPDSSPIKKPLTLNFIKKINVLGNRQMNIRYYFECDRELYCMKFPETNSLLHIMDNLLENNDGVLNILATTTPSVLYKNSNFWYNTIHDGWMLN